MNWNKQELLAILPQRLRQEEFSDVREIRLRLDRLPRLMTRTGLRELPGRVTEQELSYVINAASRYSPWAASTMKQGFLTAPGGHRIGVCGAGTDKGLSRVTSLCIRIARDIHGIAAGLPEGESLLLLGPPGSGKTTLLRDLIRRISRRETVCVVDERRELFPDGFSAGDNTDVLTDVSKERGIEMLLRTMGPAVIAVDEVTEEADCRSLVRAARCGVRLLATAHAFSVRDLKERPVYRELMQTKLFSRAAVLGADQNWSLEEVGQW